MQKKLISLSRSILADRNTRNLFFFLLLNLAFAFVELTYGLWTNSLGLISDSFHMFFDCSALLLGLAASIIAKRKPDNKFTYGFGRAEILAGLANGLFLLFIALFIMKEAIERSFEPPDVHHERLFVISVLGFIVNLIGIFVFQHGGQTHHHHHGGSCSHSAPVKKSKLDQSEYKYDNVHGYSHYSSPTILNDSQAAGAITLDMNGYAANGPQSNSSAMNNNHHHHNHSHDHHHHHHHHHHEADHNHHHHHNDSDLLIDETPANKNKHSHGRGQIMQSVLLHIIADTLGSIGVMISAVLMNQFGWMIADPLCSLFIAILISISVYPLLRDSFYILMQRIPVDIEKDLPDCLFKIQNLTGVFAITETHFWTLNSDTYIGCIKLDVTQGADPSYISSSATKLLNHLGVDKVNVQIDYV